MQAIGGYFELELRKGEPYHREAVCLNTARNCFKYILQAKRVAKVYLPYYICGVMIEPLEELHISYEFYPVDTNLDPVFEKEIPENEYLLYVNYYGLKRTTVARLAKKYKNLIVDNSQAFYERPESSANTFYSARKFFGVPDGAYLYTSETLDRVLEQDVSFMRAVHLFKRLELPPEEGYGDFRNTENSLDNNPIRTMSESTEKILASLDYNQIRFRRKENFEYLDSKLRSKNLLTPFELSEGVAPMVYPYLTENNELRKYLIKNRIFVPIYWNNVEDWCTPDSWEYRLTNGLIPLPVDQRYGKNEMDFIVSLIK